MRVLERSVAYGAEMIRYTLSFTSRADMAITVHPDLCVSVAAPPGTAPDDVDDRVRHRAAWILRQLRRFEEYHPLPFPRRFVSGESHFYLGRQYRLRVQRGEEEVRLQRPFLIVRAAKTDDVVRIAELLRAWYRERAKEIFPQRVEHCLRSAPQLAKERPRLQIREMKKRWGSCSASGTITLNHELIKASSSCIDYVIVHELCHLVVPRHGQEFYQLLRLHMPDWERRRAQLNAWFR